MFEILQRTFTKDATLSVERGIGAPISSMVGWSDLVGHLGGSSFERGLYRVVRVSDVSDWNARVSAAFPDFAGRITCFGFDWLGRVFAVDPKRSEGGQPGVIMFEPGTGEALEVPRNITSFHDEELIKHRDAALASSFHQRWLNGGGIAPEYTQCVGYKKPLFLGGADKISNLELSDIDVYWHIMGQLIVKAKGLPPGTPISISLS